MDGKSHSHERRSYSPDELSYDQINTPNEAGGSFFETKPFDKSHRSKERRLSPVAGLKLTSLEFNPLSKEANIETGKEALKKATSESFRWAGTTPQEFLLDSIANATFGKLHLTAAELEEAKREVVNQMRGFMGERVSANIPLLSADTVAVSVHETEMQAKAMENIGQSDLEDVAEFFGGTRKDVLMSGLQFAELKNDDEFLKQASEDLKVSEDTIANIAEVMSHAALDYSTRAKKYRTNNRDAAPREVYRSEAQAELYPNGGKLTKDENKIIDYVSSHVKDAIGHKPTQPMLKAIKTLHPFLDKTDEELAQQVLEIVNRERGKTKLKPEDTPSKEDDLRDAHATVRGEKQKRLARVDKLISKSYDAVTVPDALIMHDKKVKGIIEVKAYTRDEFDKWLDILESPEKSVAQNKYVFVNNLQVIESGVVSSAKEKSGVETNTYAHGTNIDALRNFAKLEGSLIETPVVLRFPNSMTVKQAERLAEIARQKGITNLVIQIMPVTYNQLQGAGKRVAQNVAKSLKKSLRPADDILLKALSKDETWGFN